MYRELQVVSPWFKRDGTTVFLWWVVKRGNIHISFCEIRRSQNEVLEKKERNSAFDHHFLTVKAYSINHPNTQRRIIPLIGHCFGGEANLVNEDEFDQGLKYNIGDKYAPYVNYDGMKSNTKPFFRNVSSFCTEPIFYIPKDYRIADSEEMDLIEYFLSRMKDLKSQHRDDIDAPANQPKFLFEPYGPYLVIQECETRTWYAIPALVHEISADLNM